MSILTDLRDDEYGFTALTPYCFGLAVDEDEVALVCPRHRVVLYSDEREGFFEHECIYCQGILFTTDAKLNGFVSKRLVHEFLATCIAGASELRPLEVELAAAELASAVLDLGEKAS